ncbi:MAG: ubiquitin-like small modifier protein 2 [Haloarculaceae archaeon]
MRVTAAVVGEETHEVDVGPDDTYADLVAAVGYSPQAVTVLVDGRPVPGDAPVDADRVEVLRLVKGG